MIEKQPDRSFEPIWFDIPGGKCFSNGIPAIDGKCIHCGHRREDHQGEKGEESK